jgi:hypothetical protein
VSEYGRWIVQTLSPMTAKTASTINLAPCFVHVGSGNRITPRGPPTTRSMHYERAALLRGVYRGDVGQESEEKIGKSAEE